MNYTLENQNIEEPVKDIRFAFSKFRNAAVHRSESNDYSLEHIKELYALIGKINDLELELRELVE